MNPSKTPAPDLEALRLHHFETHVGSAFRLEEEDLELELIEATDLGRETEDQETDRRRPFSIVLRGPSDPVLAQGIRELRHPELGAQTLFLVPLGGDDRGMRYEAVFS